MQVNLEALKSIKKTLDDTVSTLGATVSNLNNRKNTIKSEGWNDKHAAEFEEILVSIATSAKNAAKKMTSLSNDIDGLIKSVDEYKN